jgi:hypothetical protein
MVYSIKMILSAANTVCGGLPYRHLCKARIRHDVLSLDALAVCPTQHEQTGAAEYDDQQD